MENNRNFLELNALSLLAKFKITSNQKNLANMCFILKYFPLIPCINIYFIFGFQDNIKLIKLKI
jgi:hypothetical protein